MSAKKSNYLQMDICFYCGKLVFGLGGQDDFLDTVALPPACALIENQAFGACHRVCLLASGWGPEWAKQRLRRHEASPQMVRVYADKMYVAVGHRQVGDFTVIRADGPQWTVRRRMLDRIQRVGYDWQIPVEEQFNIVLRDRETLIRDIQDQLSAVGDMGMLELLELAGVADKLFAPAVLADGRLKLKEDLRRFWAPTGVSAWASYAEPLPDAVHQIITFGAQQLGFLNRNEAKAQ